MSYSDTTFLLLKKAVKGSNQPFETDVFNDNWDLVDSGVETVSDAVAALDTRLDAVEANNWVTQARIADGAVGAAELASTLDLSGKTVSVAAPSADAHASTKKYVDDSLASSVGAWTVVSSPTFGGLASGKFSSAVRYQQVGKTVRFSCRVDMTASSPVTGQITFTLPVTGPVGVVNVVAQAQTTGAVFPLITVRSGNVLSLFGAGTGTYVTGVATSSTVPMTWASGHSFEVSGTYEIS